MAGTGLPPRPADSKNTKWVFNPPPGWPTSPTGWEPQPGWQPDPSWPPAPAYWNFWKPVENSGKPRVSSFVKAIAGVLTLAATIAGALFAYLAIRPHPVTTASWVRQANAVCDQDIGALNQSAFNGALAASTGSQESSSTQVSEVDALIGDVASLSKMVGDLAALQTPEDSRAPEVQAVISSGRSLVSNLQKFSYAEQNVADHQPGTTISQNLGNALSTFKQFLTTVVTWRKAIGTLGLTQCPFWSQDPNRIPTLPSPTAPTVSSPLSAAQIANDVTGDTVGSLSRHSGATVSSASCYPSSVVQSGDGASSAECDLTYSDGAIFRAAVTDDGPNNSFQEQYQENLSAGNMANDLVGATVTSGIHTGATVSSVTCYTAQLSDTGWTDGSCDLDLSDDTVVSATVEDNGIKVSFQF